MSLDQEVTAKGISAIGVKTPVKPMSGERGLDLPPPGQILKEPPPPKGRGRWVLVGGALLVGGSVAVPYYLEHPERLHPQHILEDIVSLPGSALSKALEITQGWNWFGRELVVPDTFDPNATKGVVGKNNLVVVTPEEYARIAPPEVEENRVNVPWIFRSPDGAPPIKYKLIKPPFGVKREIKTQNGEKEELDVYYGVELKDIAVGTQVVSNWDGEISQEAKFRVNPDGTQKAFSGKITTKDRSGNPYTVNIATTKFKLAMDIPNSETKLVAGTTSTYMVERHSTPIHDGQVIGTIEGTDPISYYSTDAQAAITTSDSKGFTNIGFVTTPDGKLVTLK